MKKIIAIYLALLAAAALLTGCTQNDFTGSRMKNPDSYIMNFRHMNGSDSHTMHLLRGDALTVCAETTAGSLGIEIKSDSGEILYAGNGEVVGKFTLNIPHEGDYTISVDARYAAGKLSVTKGD